MLNFKRIFMISILTSCNVGNLQNEQKNSRSNVDKNSLTEKNGEIKAPNTQGEKKDDDIAELPVIVTGSFLTCSWTAVDGAKNVPDNAVGCNILDKDKMPIENPEQSYAFKFKDSGKEIDGESISKAEKDSGWSVFIKTPKEFDYLSTKLEISANSFAKETPSLIQALPPCEFCEITQRMSLIVLRYTEPLRLYSSVLKDANKIRSLQTYTQNQVSFTQTYYANKLQHDADQCQLAVGGADIINDTMETACLNNQTLATAYQTSANVAQAFASSLQNSINLLDNDYTNINTLTENASIKHDEVDPLFKNLSSSYSQMTCHLNTKTMEDFITCSQEEKFKGLFEEFNTNYTSFNSQLETWSTSVSTIKPIILNYLVEQQNIPDTEKLNSEKLYNNYISVLTQYCAKTELSAYITSFNATCADFAANKKIFK